VNPLFANLNESVEAIADPAFKESAATYQSGDVGDKTTSLKKRTEECYPTQALRRTSAQLQRVLEERQ